jgi:hypothetical protein
MGAIGSQAGMNLADATAVFTKLATHFPDHEMVLRSSAARSPSDTHVVEIRNKRSKLSELSEFIEAVLRCLNRETMDLEGEFRVECEHEGRSDSALWLVVTKRLRPADEAREGSPE